jgi:hypothetical protein
MEQLTQQPETDQYETANLIAALDPGRAIDTVQGWQSLRPEILDQVLDPEAMAF